MNKSRNGWVSPLSYPLPVQKAAKSRAAACCEVGVVTWGKLQTQLTGERVNYDPRMSDTTEKVCLSTTARTS